MNDQRKSRWIRKGAIVAAFIVITTSGCLHPDPQYAQTTAFKRAAVHFIARKDRDWWAEGMKLQSVLPYCPKTFEKDIGTGILVAYDYTRPSYRLTKQELIHALGPPDHINEKSAWYALHNANGMHWGIAIEFRNGYVVGSTIHGGLASSP